MGLIDFGRIAGRSVFLAILGMVCVVVPHADSQPANSVPPDHLIKLAADPWCPYNCLPKDRHQGYMIDIATRVFSAAGFRVLYQLMPWSRALRETHDARIDGAVGATHQNGRGLVFGQEPLGVDHTVVALRQDRRLTYRSPRSLDGLRIGVISNYGYDNGGPIDQYLNERAKNKPDSVVVLSNANALPQLIQMLLLNRIDAFLANSNVFGYTLRSMGIEGRVKAIDTDSYDTVWIAFSPTERGKQLARLLDQGLDRLRSTGELKKMLADYGLADWRGTLARVRKPSVERRLKVLPVL